MTGRLAHLAAIEYTADMPKRSKAAGTDEERYRVHKLGAARRGIPFHLTFEQWVTWWQATGHFHERGSKRGQYVMARKGDKGAYELGNIECVQAQENSAAPHVGRPKSNAWKEKMRNTLARKKKGATQ